MGACCGANLIFPEIDEAISVKAISDFLQEKRKELPIEAKELETYLNDKSKIPKKVNVTYQSDENLKKRIDYLDQYGKIVDEVIFILDTNPNMNLAKTKAVINELYSSYFLTYDPENTCNTIPNKLKEIIK